MSKVFHEGKAMEIYNGLKPFLKKPDLLRKKRIWAKSNPFLTVEEMFDHAFKAEMGDFLFEKLTDFEFIVFLYNGYEQTVFFKRYQYLSESTIFSTLQKTHLQEFYTFLIRNLFIFEMASFPIRKKQRFIQEALNWDENTYPYLQAQKWLQQDLAGKYECIIDPDKRQLHNPCEQVFIFHGETSYQLIRNGTHFLTLNGGDLQIVDLQTGLKDVSFEYVNSYLVSPSEDYLIFDHIEDYSISIVHLPTGNGLSHLMGHSNDINGLFLNQNEDRLVSTDLDGNVKVWDLLQGTGIKSMKLEGTLVGISSDGTVWIMKDSRRISIWDSVKDTEIMAYGVSEFWFFPQQDIFLVSQNDGLTSYDFHTGSEWFLPINQIISYKSQRGIHLFNNERKIAVQTDKQHIQIWNLNDGTLDTTIENKYDFGTLKYYANDSMLLSVDFGSMQNWDLKTGKKIAIDYCFELGHHFFDQDTKLISTPVNGEMIIRDSRTFERIASYYATQKANEFLFSNELQNVISICEDYEIDVFEFRVYAMETILQQQGATGMKFILTHDGVCELKIAPDCKKVIYYNYATDQVEVFDLQSDAKIFEKESELQIFSFSPDNDWLVVASDSTHFCLVNSRTLVETVFAMEDAAIKEIKFTPDSQSVAVVTSNEKLLVWDIETGTMQRDFDGVLSVSFSTNGRWVAMADARKPIKVVEMDSEKEVAALSIPEDAFIYVEFCHSGKYLFTSSANGLLAVWETENWSMLWQTTINQRFNEIIHSATFTKNDLYVAVVLEGNLRYSSYHSWHLYNTSTGELLRTSEISIGGKQNLISPDSTWAVSITNPITSMNLHHQCIFIENLVTGMESFFWCYGEIEAFNWRSANELVVINEFGDVFNLALAEWKNADLDDWIDDIDDLDDDDYDELVLDDEI